MTVGPTFCNNPYGGGKQIILDVAVTSIDGTTRTNDNKSDQPFNARYKQKIQKYEKVARQNGFGFVPAIFSYGGQMHKRIKRLILEQIRLKLQLVVGEVKNQRFIHHEVLRSSNFCSNQ